MDKLVNIAKKKQKLVNITKKKQTPRYREQSSGEKEGGRDNIRMGIQKYEL